MQLAYLSILMASVPLVVHSQCPPGIQHPCSCSTSRLEPVSIVCEKAVSLSVVQQALGTPQVVIDRLVISNTPIPFLPANAFGSYQIKRLVLRNNGLQTIHPSAFIGPLLNTLEELEIRNNKLGQVPQTGVPSLPNLRTLVLAKNAIANLRALDFQRYQSRINVLRKLDLSGNRLTTIDPNVFSGLTAIKEINLDKNFLPAIPTAALSQIQSLEDLSIAVNKINHVPMGALQFPNLKSLSLEVNSIPSIPSEAFQGVPNLLYLYLSSNKFKTIPGNMFRYVPKLRVLAIGNNREIRSIPRNAFSSLPELVRLEMSDCQIENIQPGTFQNIRKVQVIVLNKNKIRRVTRTMFQNLPELVSLDLRANEISYAEDGAWRSLPALKHLDISGNRLQTLQPRTFEGTFRKTTPETTRVLYIYENEWVCNTSLQWFRRWLRENPKIMINAPGYRPTVCRKPQHLFNLPIRRVDPILTTRPPTTTTAEKNGKEEQQTGGKPQTTLGGVNLAVVILGIIMIVLGISVVLLMVVRALVSKNRRERKEENEEARRLGLGSTISGYQSHIGSAYPSPPTPEPGSFRGHPNRGYFLNRPWYWWF